MVTRQLDSREIPCVSMSKIFLGMHKYLSIVNSGLSVIIVGRVVHKRQQLSGVMWVQRNVLPLVKAHSERRLWTTPALTLIFPKSINLWGID